MNEYQQQLLDHYHSPRNFGKPSFTPTHYAKASNISCGDEVEVWLKVGKDKIVEDVAFAGEGCSISIGASSLLFDQLKGKTLEFVENLTENDILEIVGIPLTLTRIKCATLPLFALQDSLKAPMNK